MLTHLDLFSGIGGFALAAQWAGFETIGFVEIDKYCQKVLKKNFPNVPIVEDIRNVEKIKEVVANSSKQRLEREARQGIQGNIYGFIGDSTTTRDRTPTIDQPPITLITGGFPCQPFSVAGKRGGKADDRYLWKEMLNIIEIFKPAWVLGENVAGIVRMELDNCLSDLEGIGYSTQTFIIPACAVNAPHRRDRVWIVAHNASYRCNSGSTLGRDRQCDVDQNRQTSQSQQAGKEWFSEFGQIDNVPNSERTGIWQDNRGLWQGVSGTARGQEPITTKNDSTRVQGLNSKLGTPCKTRQGGKNTTEISNNGNPRGTQDWWAVEPELGRVAHGIPHRVDRLKCLGNAIVPQVVYQILKGIREVMELKI